MTKSSLHDVSVYPDSSDFIARCTTCGWKGSLTQERDEAVMDAVAHLASHVNFEDVPIAVATGTRRYSKADYARWFAQHARRQERDRARAAEHRDPLEPSEAELLAEQRLHQHLQALRALTYRKLSVLRRNGAVVLTSTLEDIEASLASTSGSIADLERRMRENDRCFPQIGLVAFNGRRHASRLAEVAERRRAGYHAYAWHEDQPEGTCVVCTCGVMVLGSLNLDFTEAEFKAASGHRAGRAWAK